MAVLTYTMAAPLIVDGDFRDTDAVITVATATPFEITDCEAVAAIDTEGDWIIPAEE